MTYPILIPLPTPFPVGPANAYLFIDPEPLLVDCGINSDDSWDALVRGLADHRLSPADLQKVVVTHAHVDHMGMGGRIVENSGATLLIWDQIAPWAYHTAAMWRQRLRFLHVTLNQLDLADDERDGILEGMTRVMDIWSPVPEDRIEAFSLDDMLMMGGLPWQVIYAPGHSTTQTCFYQPETAQFIAGDMLLPLTPAPVLEQPLIGGYEREASLPKLLEMFDVIEAMNISHVYPGHGDPFTDHRTLIDRQRQRIATRKAECLELVRAGHEQVGELLEIMYGHHPRGSRFTGLSTLVGYLDLLLVDGSVEEKVVDGMKRYGYNPPKNAANASASPSDD